MNGSPMDRGSSAEVLSSAAAGRISNHAQCALSAGKYNGRNHIRGSSKMRRHLVAEASCLALLPLFCLLLLGVVVVSAESSTCGRPPCCEVSDGVLTSCSACNAETTTLNLNRCSISSIATGE
jgi:hypothetical protein